MKTLRRLCAASALTMMLSLPALAGDISCPPVAPPPPPGEIQTTALGEIHTPGVIQNGAPGQINIPADEASTFDPATQATLGLLRAVLGLV